MVKQGLHRRSDHYSWQKDAKEVTCKYISKHGGHLADTGAVDDNDTAAIAYDSLRFHLSV